MNRVTSRIVSTIGVLLGIAGMEHGFFEVLQGKTDKAAKRQITNQQSSK